MRLGAVATALVALALLAAGCGGGGTTTVIERTVTVESQGEGGSTEPGDDGGSGSADDEGEGSGGESSNSGGGSADAEEAAAEEAQESAAQPEDQIEEPTRVVHLQTFRSPSGNIGCAMFEGGARCDIRNRDWSPPARPASCSDQVDFGQGLTVSHDGKASFVCAGDTTLLPSGTALGYGEASEFGGTTCMSSRSGMTCANHAGHGFFISIRSYRTF